jgi:small-conductance mechanosensitive channel
MDLNAFLEIEVFNFKDHSLTVMQLFTVLVIFIITKLISIVLKFLVLAYKKVSKSKVSRGKPIYKLVMYFVWIISITFMLEAIGIGISIILAGSAALLVGIGLGIQQTFNDILSGLILLFERSVRENDILEIDGDVVKIQKIGFRTSTGLNRDLILVILPNSLITSDKVINWNNQSENTRFKIEVRVAYGSDVEKVISLLEKCAFEHSEIRPDQIVEARLIDFGPSSLNFQLLFFSDNIFQIERIKSDVRRIVNRKFSDEGIIIPLPQLDVYVKPN